MGMVMLFEVMLAIGSGSNGIPTHPLEHAVTFVTACESLFHWTMPNSRAQPNIAEKNTKVKYSIKL